MRAFSEQLVSYPFSAVQQRGIRIYIHFNLPVPCSQELLFVHIPAALASFFFRFDFHEPRPKETTIAILKPELDNFIALLNFLKNQLPDKEIPDVLIIETAKEEVSFPISSLLQKLSYASERGPDKTKRYYVTLNADEAISTCTVVCAITKGLPLFGYLPEESWIPLLAGKLIGSSF